jgi:serine/threonine protein kinase
MGVVYEAQQVSLGRRVALKVLPFAAALDPRQRQRFQLEAQAAAHLHHPHIVPVFAVGREQGVHFYAMQFIEGRSLAGVVRELRRQAQARADADRSSPTGAQDAAGGPGPAGKERVPGEGLTPAPVSSTRDRAFFRAVARLGLQAAEALEHAHALGVIHRDVKPGNLLIDGRGELYVTDFGLARFLDDPGPTRTGDLMGTLAYMSPEQALGRREVDHRADIYSLGATLYELLTLHTAFQGRDRQELLRKIAQDEPVRPRRLNPAVPRDLETIILKAMEKERSGRYATAKDLADDLRRFLADEPVRARRPNLLEKAAKWSRRHRSVVATAAVLLPLTMAVAGGLLLSEQRRTAAANLALREANRAFRDNIRDTFAVADAATMLAMGRFSADAQGVDRPIEPDKYYRLALDYYQKVASLPATDTEMQAIVARAYHRIGFTRMLSGREGGEQAFQAAIDRFEALIRIEPRERQHRLNLADTLNNWAMMTTIARGPARAEPLYRKAIAIRKDLALNYPPVEPDELAQLAWNEVGWANVLEQLQRKDEAEATRSSLMAFYRELTARLPAPPHPLRRSLAEKHREPGLGAVQNGALRDAELYYRLALTLDPDDPLTCNNLAWLLVNNPGASPHDPSEALPLARKAVEGRPEAGGFWNTLAVAQYRLGQLQEARDAFDRSMAFNHGGDPSDWLFLAMIHAREGRPAWAWYWYALSASWLAGNAPQDPELYRSKEFRRFQNEATSLLSPRPAGPVNPRTSSIGRVRPWRLGRS